MITVAADANGIILTDNGPGLPADTAEGILDFGIRVSSREAYVSPTRGAEGNALKTLIAMPFVVDPDEGQVDIEARGAHHASLGEVFKSEFGGQMLAPGANHLIDCCGVEGSVVAPHLALIPKSERLGRAF